MSMPKNRLCHGVAFHSPRRPHPLPMRLIPVRAIACRSGYGNVAGCRGVLPGASGDGFGSDRTQSEGKSRRGKLSADNWRSAWPKMPRTTSILRATTLPRRNRHRVCSELPTYAYIRGNVCSISQPSRPVEIYTEECVDSGLLEGLERGKYRTTFYLMAPTRRR